MQTSGNASSPDSLPRVSRPWGWFETLAEGLDYRVKRLLIQPRMRLSLQRHRHRCEHWVVVAGSGLLHLEGQDIPAEPGTTLFIPVRALHRASAGAEALVIVEVQRGEELREDDIERLADDHGRADDHGLVLGDRI
ncbi:MULTISPECIES: phosphomannose isomerase type II C-terminal cupin domain [Aphanothece]|uniref:phosphomannose isomerase type II C-terminal cupin domain n=1 Tax=Aphanothece TaxID=1121 RepID=UPI0039851366